MQSLKLSDFGMGTETSPGDLMNTACGSLAYSAPELLIGENYDGHAVGMCSPLRTLAVTAAVR